MKLIIGIVSRLISPLLNRGLGKIPGVIPLYRRFWGWCGFKGIRLVRVNDFKMYVICRDWAVAPTMIFAHSWEPEETRICKQYVKEGMTVVDAGAYIGYYSLLTSRLVGNKGKVYAFEPSPESLSVLKKNIQLNNCKNIQVVEKALTDKIGDASYYLVHNNPSNSSTIEALEYREKITVSTTTLDEVIGNQRVDVVKMDIEGGERAALNGMPNVISNNPNLVMLVEVYLQGIVSAGGDLKEHIEFLINRFHLHIVKKDGITDEVGYVDIRNTIEKRTAINLLCRRRNNDV